MKKQERKEEKGITLVALVVTIIVLIILAGVSIAMLVGETGIVTQTQIVAQDTEIKGDEEKIRLAMVAAQIANNGDIALKGDIEIALLENGTKSIVVDNEDGTRNIIFLDSRKIYKINNDGSIENTNSDFDSIYVAPASQDDARNEGVIGIGTDGQPVDMDLWNWCYDIQSNGYALNDVKVINGELAEAKGYLGGFSIDGRIDGVIPQYIKTASDDKFIPVTNLYNTFRECINLVVPPVIPSTVTQMYTTFNSCKNLKESPELPENLINMYGLFYRMLKFN